MSKLPSKPQPKPTSGRVFVVDHVPKNERPAPKTPITPAVVEKK